METAENRIRNRIQTVENTGDLVDTELTETCRANTKMSEDERV